MAELPADRPRPSAVHRRRLLALVALLIAAYVLAADLANVDLGRADNGDFPRLVGRWITKPVGFAVFWPPRESPEWQRRFFHCFHALWETPPVSEARPAVAWDAGSANLVWAPALLVQQRMRHDGLLDVRLLGGLLRGLRLVALLALFGTLAALLSERSVWWPLAASVPCVLALADPRAATYFNSFYREAVTLLYAPALIAALLAFAVLPGRWPIAILTVATILVASTATAHVPIALLGAVTLPVALWLRTRGKPSQDAHGLAVALGVAAMLAAAVLMSFATPTQVRSNVAFQALFFGALQVSDDPLRDVTELGLPPEAGALVGKTAFEDASQPFRDAHPGLVRHGLVVRLLWHRPAIAWRLLSRAAADVWGGDQAFRYVADATCTPPLPRLAWWTNLKRACVPNGGAMLMLLGLAAAAGAWRASRPGLAESVAGMALAFVALTALIEIAAAALGNGLSDLGRHLVVASFFADATLGLGVLQLAFVRHPTIHQALANRPR